ncbi:MAG TPA: hypothetical protein VGI19_14690 [Candidatus Cybelea sp.]|jgi:hypothetical protein
MRTLLRLAGAFGCAATIVTAGCSSSSSVATLPVPATAEQSEPAQPQQHIIHYMGTRAMPPPLPTGITFVYGGGPVLVKPKIYLIFWGFKTYGDPDKVKPLLKDYAKHIGGSGYDNIYTQYYETSGGKKADIKNPGSQFGGAWEDDTDPVPANPTDAQVEAEASAGVKHFGFNPNGSYVVATPHDHSTQGFGSSFCAYHSYALNNGKAISYTNLPYQPDVGGLCGANDISPPADEPGVDEGITIVEGHEYGESITDPEPHSGWTYQLYTEIGDYCAWYDVQNDPFGDKSYTAQPMYSNASQSCVHSY